MPGHMKKPHTDEVNMTFIGPVAMIEQAREVMRSLGFEMEGSVTLNQQTVGSIPWRESIHFNEIHAGSYISGARFREGMTQVELAARTGIPRRHISEMENGKRPIGKSNARKLAAALNINPRALLAV